MVNARRSQPDLRDFKTLAFPAEQVGGGHADIFKSQFADRRGVILAAHPAQRAHQTDTGRIHRHDDAGMPAGAVGFRIAHAHHDQKTAVRMRGAGDEPFAPVDDVVVAVAHHARGDIGCIRRGDVGLGHAEGRTGFCLEQRPQPARLLFRRGAVLQRDHVGHVRRLAVEDFGGPEQPPHDLGQRRIIEVGETASPAHHRRVRAGRDSTVPPRAPSAAVRHEGRRLAAVRDVLQPGAVARQHFPVEEGLQLLSPCFRPFG